MSVLEDSYEDILEKAQRGLGLSDLEVLERSGLSMIDIEAAKKGTFDEDAAVRLAESLELNPDALLQIGRGTYRPKVDLPEGVKPFTTPAPVPGYEEMTVNSYLIFDPASREGALFDTGMSLTEVQAFLKEAAITVKHVALTHTHGDHVGALGEARKLFPDARILGPEGEPWEGVEPIAPLDRFNIGSLVVEARLTPGHSPGGTSYLIAGLEMPVAVVGDALFAGSMGGVPQEKYFEALTAVQDHILSNPPETILLPGHRSPTTVGQEKSNNPFFPPIEV